MDHPLIAQAVRKAAVAWVAVGDRPARLVWCAPVDGVLWVVSGPGEQSAPELETADRALVTLRGHHGGRIVCWPARVGRARPGDDRWDEVAPTLAGRRLNATRGTAELVAHWADRCALTSLTPDGDPVDPPGSAGPSRTG